MRFPSGAAGPVTETVGLFAAGTATLTDWLADGLGGDWRPRDPGWTSLADAADALRPSVPLSREAVIPMGDWTLLLNNAPRGTDVGVLPSLAARELGIRAFRATNVARRPYPGCILECFGPDGRPPLLSVRSIAAANDGGRWVFETSGTPFEFERLDAYTSRRKRDRFTPELLERYLAALGAPLDVEPTWPAARALELPGHPRGACRRDGAGTHRY